MMQDRVAKGEAVEIYCDPFATKVMRYFQLVHRVNKPKNLQ
jgi:hypothetical protein